MSEQPVQEQGILNRYLSALAYRDFRLLYLGGPGDIW